MQEKETKTAFNEYIIENMMLLNRHSYMPCILVNQYANQKFITLLHKSPELSERIAKLHAEAIELRKADQAAVRRYFNYRSSRGIAMNIIFTMSVM